MHGRDPNGHVGLPGSPLEAEVAQDALSCDTSDWRSFTTGHTRRCRLSTKAGRDKM
jgi:hypothetical protein